MSPSFVWRSHARVQALRPHCAAEQAFAAYYVTSDDTPRDVDADDADE